MDKRDSLLQEEPSAISLATKPSTESHPSRSIFYWSAEANSDWSYDPG